MYVQLYPKDQYCLSLMCSFTHCHIHVTTNTTITPSRSNTMSRPSPMCDLSEHMLRRPILCYDGDGLLSGISRLAYRPQKDRSATRRERTMATPKVKTTDQAVQTTLSFVQDVLSASPQTNVTVRLWNGTVWKPTFTPPSDEAQPDRPQKSFTLVLQHPGALRRMFLPPSELNLGEAYIYNDFDIEGDIEAVFPFADHFINGRWGKLEQGRYGKRLLSLPKFGQPSPHDSAPKLHGTRHSKERDRQAGTYHYDRSNDFYALWLDRRMIYSCAYLATTEDTLDPAYDT